MGKTLAIGDIHCKLWIIDEVRKIADDYDRIVFVGDYADDWKATPQDSINTWYALKSLQDNNPDKVVILSGNHDYIYTHYTKTTQSGYNPLTETILNADHKELAAWLRELPITVEIDKVTYSHGGITEGWDGKLDSVSLWKDDSPLWARPVQSNFKKEQTAYALLNQCVGHTPVDTIKRLIISKDNSYYTPVSRESASIWSEIGQEYFNILFIDTFSTYSDGTPIGDGTVLEVIDGKRFNKTKLEGVHNV